MAATVIVTLDRRELERLVTSDEVRDLVEDVAEPVVAMARALAPKDSGRGASTIHSEMVLEDGEWEAHISWTWPDSYYLWFHEKGSRQLPARPFLVPALEAAR